MTDDQDELGTYLADGWDVVGYATNVLLTGSTTQHILLRKGASLARCSIVDMGGKEVGRRVDVLTPRAAPPPKTGFFQAKRS